MTPTLGPCLLPHALPALYIRSEIHRPEELRTARVHGEGIQRTHALAWRKSSPEIKLVPAERETEAKSS